MVGHDDNKIVGTDWKNDWIIDGNTKPDSRQDFGNGRVKPHDAMFSEIRMCYIDRLNGDNE